jgi:hypothetical protein
LGPQIKALGALKSNKMQQGCIYIGKYATPLPSRVSVDVTWGKKSKQGRVKRGNVKDKRKRNEKGK